MCAPIRRLANQINAALDLGANVNVHAARIRAQFTDEEWQILIKTPALAGYAVMMSSFSGPVGINKEIAALHRAMHEAGDAAQLTRSWGWSATNIHLPTKSTTSAQTAQTPLR